MEAGYSRKGTLKIKDITTQNFFRFKWMQNGKSKQIIRRYNENNKEEKRKEIEESQQQILKEIQPILQNQMESVKKKRRENAKKYNSEQITCDGCGKEMRRDSWMRHRKKCF